MELLVSDWLKFKKMFWEKVQNEVFQGLHRNSWIEKHPCHVQFYLSHLWRKSLKVRHGYNQGFTNPWYNIALTVALKMSSFGDWINFSNTIKPRITIFDPHIDPGGTCQLSLCHLTLDWFYGLLSLNWCQLFVIRSVSPLPYNLAIYAHIFLVHTLFMAVTCQPDICHLTLTSFSLSTDDYVKFVRYRDYPELWWLPYDIWSSYLVHALS